MCAQKCYADYLHSVRRGGALLYKHERFSRTEVRFMVVDKSRANVAIVCCNTKGLITRIPSFRFFEAFVN